MSLTYVFYFVPPRRRYAVADRTSAHRLYHIKNEQQTAGLTQSAARKSVSYHLNFEIANIFPDERLCQNGEKKPENAEDIVKKCSVKQKRKEYNLE